MKTILLFPSLNSVSKDFFTGLSSDSKKTLRRSSNAVIFCAFFSILSIYLKSGQFTFLFGVWSYNTSNASNACNPLHWTLILAILSIIERTISDFHRSQYGIITLFVQYVRVRITAFVSLDSGWTYSGSIQTLKKKNSIWCMIDTQNVRHNKRNQTKIFSLSLYYLCSLSNRQFSIQNPSLSIRCVWFCLSLREISSILKRFLV